MVNTHSKEWKVYTKHIHILYILREGQSGVGGGDVDGTILASQPVLMLGRDDDAGAAVLRLHVRIGCIWIVNIFHAPPQHERTTQPHTSSADALGVYRDGTHDHIHTCAHEKRTQYWQWMDLHIVVHDMMARCSECAQDKRT